MSVTFFPMGQGPLSAARKKAAEAELPKLQEEWFLSKVPSFEVWCAATCYDPLRDDGGPVFQAMMFHLLTSGSISKKLQVITGGDGYEDHYLASREPMEYPTYVDHTNRYMMTVGKKQRIYNDRRNDTIEHDDNGNTPCSSSTAR